MCLGRNITDDERQRCPTTFNSGAMKTNAGIGEHAILNKIKRRLLTLSTALVLLWICVLVWGERRIFEQSVAQCLWQQWESWVRDKEDLSTESIADPL